MGYRTLKYDEIRFIALCNPKSNRIPHFSQKELLSLPQLRLFGYGFVRNRPDTHGPEKRT